MCVRLKKNFEFVSQLFNWFCAANWKRSHVRRKKLRNPAWKSELLRCHNGLEIPTKLCINQEKISVWKELSWCVLEHGVISVSYYRKFCEVGLLFDLQITRPPRYSTPQLILPSRQAEPKRNKDLGILEPNSSVNTPDWGELSSYKVGLSILRGSRHSQIEAEQPFNTQPTPESAKMETPRNSGKTHRDKPDMRTASAEVRSAEDLIAMQETQSSRPKGMDQSRTRESTHSQGTVCCIKNETTFVSE